MLAKHAPPNAQHSATLASSRSMLTARISAFSVFIGFVSAPEPHQQMRLHDKPHVIPNSVQ